MESRPQSGLVLHRTRNRVPDAALNAPHARKAAVVGHVRSLGRPRRDGAYARNHEQALAGKIALLRARAVAQQAPQHELLSLGQRRSKLDEMDKLGGKRRHLRVGGLNLGQPLGQSGRGEGRGTG